MLEYRWEEDVKDWILERRNGTPDIAEAFVRFFSLAFKNTRYPEQAWFGAHTGTLSLVVGGIFLASAVSSGDDKGVWLLVDKAPESIEGLEYRPVKSTRKSKTPLVWVHAPALKDVVKIAEMDRIWEAYSRASEKIFNSPISRGRGESWQVTHRKKRLSDFWKVTLINKFDPSVIDENFESQSQASGAGFGDPETNRKVERAAISFVTKWYQIHGWSVESVEGDKCGYDLRCVRNNAEEHVEVKGVQGGIPSFIITAGEVRQARINSLFTICIVTSALSNQPKMIRYSGGEFVSNFSLEPLSFRASLSL
jgi:hypothetical protein